MNLGGRYLTEEDLRNAGFKHLGRNVRIHERASVYGAENISLGNHVRIDDFSILIATGQLIIGDHVSIPNFCFLGAKFGLTMEDFVTLAPGVKIFTASDDYSGERLTGPTVPTEWTGGRKGAVVLRRHVILGAGSVVLPGCTLGEGAAVGALSLVKEDLEPWGVYAGTPVRRLHARQRELLKLEMELRKVETHEH
ncbi:galactoside O-acetyltransferase [Verrucomicrobiota bacterium]|nr:galactoside O-acetyltransferase [Verrucomicrobiota bacterium]